jgi:hypothetical protein
MWESKTPGSQRREDPHLHVTERLPAGGYMGIWLAT